MAGAQRSAVLLLLYSALRSCGVCGLRHACGARDPTPVIARGRTECALALHLLPDSADTSPTLEGWGMLRELSDIWSRTPIYVLTAFPSKKRHQRKVGYIRNETDIRVKLAELQRNLVNIGIGAQDILPYVCTDLRRGQSPLRHHLEIAASHVAFYDDAVHRNCSHALVVEDDTRINRLSARTANNIVSVVQDMLSNKYAGWRLLLLGHFPSAPLRLLDVARGLFVTPVPKTSHFYLASRRHMEYIVHERLVSSRTSRCLGEECYFTRANSGDMYAVVPGVAFQATSPGMARRVMGYASLGFIAEEHPYVFQCVLECLMASIIVVLSAALALGSLCLCPRHMGRSARHVLAALAFVSAFSVLSVVNPPLSMTDVLGTMGLATIDYNAELPREFPY